MDDNMQLKTSQYIINCPKPIRTVVRDGLILTPPFCNHVVQT